MAVPLADGWCWANVGLTFGHFYSVPDESHRYIGRGYIVGTTFGQCKGVGFFKSQQYVGDIIWPTYLKTFFVH